MAEGRNRNSRTHNARLNFCAHANDGDMKQHRQPPRYLVIDEDQKRFNLIPPTFDDSKLIDRVASLQKQGRSVRLVNVEDPDLTDEAAITWATEFYRCTYTNEPVR